MEETNLENQNEVTNCAEMSPEEPVADAAHTSEEEAEALAEEVQEIDYAALAAEDLATLRAQFPALKGLTSLAALSDPVRYAELRECGLTPKEAYLAIGGTPRRASDNRAHLFSAVPRASTATTEAISAAEMAEARRLFSNLTDAQICKLYKKVTN
jgi:hypothetical protein